MLDTADRLRSYGSLPTPVVDRVAEVAERQEPFVRWEDYFSSLDIPEPIVFENPNSTKCDISLLDIIPSGDYDEREATVMHLPMGNALTPNMMFQAVTVRESNPGSRLIAVGNPSGPGYNSGILPSHKYRKAVSRGDLLATVDPVILYLRSQGVSRTNHVGYSYGAEKAAVAANVSSVYGQLVGRTVHIEPVSLKIRSVAELARAFASSGEMLRDYVEATELDAFKDAFDSSNSGLNFNLGLLRLTNLAITKGLARGLFGDRLEAAFKFQDQLRELDYPEEVGMQEVGMKSTVAWGSSSELADNSLMFRVISKLRSRFGRDRIKPIVLDGQKHALANDIHLHAAIITAGLTS